MEREESRVVVIGGVNMDLKAHTAAPARGGTSNPGSTELSPGGVARNVAENLARLGTRVHLVAAVGRDVLGDRVLAETAAAGVDVSAVHRGDLSTGTYTAVLDSSGELVIAVADMSATDAFGPEKVAAVRGLVEGADLLVLDANLPPATIRLALELATAAQVPVLVDPVSAPKAERLRSLLDVAHPLFAITPNRAELAALTGLETSSTELAVAAATRLHGRGVQHVWVRLGAEGSLLSSTGTPIVFLPADQGDVVDVTGAGDAMLAGFCHALLRGRSPAEAAAYGQATAALTVSVGSTVRADLTAQLVDQHLNGRQR